MSDSTEPGVRRRPAQPGRRRPAGKVQKARPVSTAQRHRFYRQLLLLCLGLIGSFALPGSLARLTWIGYLGLTTLLFRLPGAGRWHRILALASLLAELLWLCAPQTLRLTGLPLLVLFTLFIGRSLRLLLQALASEREVDGQVLAGASAGYLLLGIAGGLVLTVIDSLLPGSFRDSITGLSLSMPAIGSLAQAGHLWDQGFQRLNYFAFVTLTTVGYGDVIPTAPVVQLVCIALSVVGPLYLALVLGLLISRLSGAAGGKSPPPAPDAD
ncbi:MAG: ion channel [Synechococcaceae cyanobacterium ELA263]